MNARKVESIRPDISLDPLFQAKIFCFVFVLVFPMLSSVYFVWVFRVQWRHNTNP